MSFAPIDLMSPDEHNMFEAFTLINENFQLVSEDLEALQSGTNHAHDYSLLYAPLVHYHDSDYAEIVHNHDSAYSAITHDHDTAYPAIDHNHNTVYSAINHDHDGDYSPTGHNHDLAYANVVHEHDLFYSLLTHNHDSVYASIGHDHDEAYSALAHNHSGVYSESGHSHTEADITDLGPYANLVDGRVPVTELGSGTANSGVFLRGDQSWQAVVMPDADIDVVGGRLDYVSNVQIKWSFLQNNQIRLYNSSTGKWEIVHLSSETVASNAATDINGDLLTYDVIYDVFAEYLSSTSMNLVFSKWSLTDYGTSSRTSAWVTSTPYKAGQRVSSGGNYYLCVTAHTSGTFATDLAQGKWVDNGGTSGADFNGLYRFDGTIVSGNDNNNKKRRWLGIVLLVNSSGPKFAESDTTSYISNYYNPKIRKIIAANSETGYAFWAVDSYREYNGGTGITRAKTIQCVTGQSLFWLTARYRTDSGTYIEVGMSINTTGAVFSTTLIVEGLSAQARPLVHYIDTPVGLSYITTVEKRSQGSGNGVLYHHPLITEGMVKC